MECQKIEIMERMKMTRVTSAKRRRYKKKRYNLKYRRRAIHEVHFVVGSRRKKGRAERASRPSIRAREGARGIELQRIENEKEEGASVASDRERAGRACERGYVREGCNCKGQSKTKRKKGRALRANESEQGEHASEDTSERDVSAKGK